MVLVAAALGAVLAQAPAPSTGESPAPPEVTAAPTSDRPERQAEPEPTKKGEPKGWFELEEDEENPFARRGYHARSYLAGGLSGTLLVTSGTLYVLTRIEEARLKNPASFQNRDQVYASLKRGEQLQVASVITGAAGLAFGVAATVMYVIDHRSTEPQAVQWVPTANGVAIAGRLP